MEPFRKMRKQALKDYIKDNKIGNVSGNKDVLLKRIEDFQKINAPESEVINLPSSLKNKKLKLGSLIINIHNNLGQTHPNYVGTPPAHIRRFARKADNASEEEKEDIIDVIKPHLKKAKTQAKKWAKVEGLSSTPKVNKNIPISAKAQKSKDIISAELAKLKPAKGLQSDFKDSLAGLFGNR